MQPIFLASIVVAASIIFALIPTAYALANIHCVPKWCQKVLDAELESATIYADGQQDCADQLFKQGHNKAIVAFAWRRKTGGCIPMTERCTERDLHSLSEEEAPVDEIEPSNEHGIADYFYCYKACERIMVDGHARTRNSTDVFPIPGSSTTLVCDDGRRFVGSSESVCDFSGNVRSNWLLIGSCGKPNETDVFCFNEEKLQPVVGCAPHFRVNSSYCASGHLELNKPGVFFSPNWPGKYPHNCKVDIIIQAPSGAGVRLTVGSFQGEHCRDNLTVLARSNHRQVLNSYTFCDNKFQQYPVTLESTSNVLQMQFRSDHSNHAHGFVAHFSFVYYCPSMQVPNGTVTITHQSQSLVWHPIIPSVARISCLPNFVLYGAAEIACGENRKWSADAPVCRPVGTGPNSAERLDDSGITEMRINCTSGSLIVFTVFVAILASFAAGGAAALFLVRSPHRRLNEEPAVRMSDCANGDALLLKADASATKNEGEDNLAYCSQ